MSSISVKTPDYNIESMVFDRNLKNLTLVQNIYQVIEHLKGNRMAQSSAS